jgi:hypothetical protein
VDQEAGSRASESVPGIVELKRATVDWTRRTGRSAQQAAAPPLPSWFRPGRVFFQSDATDVIAAHSLHAVPEAGPRIPASCGANRHLTAGSIDATGIGPAFSAFQGPAARACAGDPAGCAAQVRGGEEVNLTEHANWAVANWKWLLIAGLLAMCGWDLMEVLVLE